MNALDWITRTLVIIGALNWGLATVGFNFVSFIFRTNILVLIVYALIGVAGLWELIRLLTYRLG